MLILQEKIRNKRHVQRIKGIQCTYAWKNYSKDFGGSESLEVISEEGGTALRRTLADVRPRAVPSRADVPLRFRFLITSVFKESGRITP